MEYFISIFGTVISGTFVLILSQIILEFYIKPRKKLSELSGNLSARFLDHHAQYINEKLSTEKIEHIRNASTALLAQACLCYRSHKKREKYLDISKEVNFILSCSRIQKDYFEKIISSIKKIESLSDGNIIITYEKNT